MSEFAGLLNSRVELWQQTQDRLTSGLSADTWVKVGNYRAHIVAEGAGKAVEGMSLSALSRYRVIVRNSASFQVDQRVKWANRLLCIRQVVSSPIQADRIVLHCEELRA